MPAPIIVAYDPLTEDRAPVELALAAAEVTGASVVAATAYPWGVTGEWTEPYVVDTELEGRVNGAMRRLHEDLAVETRVVSDRSVPRALHALAREIEAELIVVGSTGRGDIGRVLPGSTAERLLHGAPCPIALAPHGYKRATVETIAVGFVDTPDGRTALAGAHALAKRAGARLRVVCVLHPSGGLDAAFAPGLRPQRGITLEGRHRTEAEAALDRVLGELAEGVEIEREVHVDDPAEVLLRISEHADLLVCGSRGYGPLRSVLLGGVSRRLVDGAHCPLLVIPREADRPLKDRIGLAVAGSIVY